MKTIKILLALGLIYNGITSHAQSYLGLSVDNYSGIHSLISNPSNVVDSRFKFKFNMLSISAFGGSDYFGINMSDIFKSDNGFNFEDDIIKFPSDSNNFFFNIDVLGPSFMFNASKKSSIGVISRVRAFMNINNISGELYENISDNFDVGEDFNFNSQNLTGTIHAWAEIGLVYGRILVDKKHNFLKGGVTLKYLQGAGSLYMNSPNFTGQYTANNEQLTTTGSLSYGLSDGFNNNDIDFSNLTAGFGADIGFTYEWRPNAIKDSLTTRKQNKYKLKLAASITDIGSIEYNESEITTFNLDQTVNTSNFDDDTQEFLDNNYTGVESIINQKIKLPTALHLLADYQLRNKIYLSLQGHFSLIENNTPNTNSIINSVTLSPRLETKWFSVYSPVSFRQYGDLSWGAGLRLGPLMVGSGSILTNLLSSTSKTTDIYLGFKI